MSNSKELKMTAIMAWMAVPFLIISSLIWFNFGGETGPWILIAFAILQNIPLAVMYTIRYRKMLEIEGKTGLDHNSIRKEVVLRAFNTGEIVIANVDGNGKISSYKEI